MTNRGNSILMLEATVERGESEANFRFQHPKPERHGPFAMRMLTANLTARSVSGDAVLKVYSKKTALVEACPVFPHAQRVDAMLEKMKKMLNEANKSMFDVEVNLQVSRTDPVLPNTMELEFGLSSGTYFYCTSRALLWALGFRENQTVKASDITGFPHNKGWVIKNPNTSLDAVESVKGNAVDGSSYINVILAGERTSWTRAQNARKVFAFEAFKRRRRREKAQKKAEREAQREQEAAARPLTADSEEARQEEEELDMAIAEADAYAEAGDEWQEPRAKRSKDEEEFAYEESNETELEKWIKFQEKDEHDAKNLAHEWGLVSVTTAPVAEVSAKISYSTYGGRGEEILEKLADGLRDSDLHFSEDERTLQWTYSKDTRKLTVNYLGEFHTARLELSVNLARDLKLPANMSFEAKGKVFTSRKRLGIIGNNHEIGKDVPFPLLIVKLGGFPNTSTPSGDVCSLGMLTSYARASVASSLLLHFDDKIGEKWFTITFQSVDGVRVEFPRTALLKVSFLAE